MATISSNRPSQANQAQSDWQVEYLRLEAEVDLLLLRLTTLMQQQKQISHLELPPIPRSHERQN